VVTDQGIQMLAITSSRRLAWLKAISREELSEDAENVWVCERHFVKGQYIATVTVQYLGFRITDRTVIVSL